MLMPSDYLALLGCLALGALLCLGVLSNRKWLNAIAYTVAATIFVIHLPLPGKEYLWVWALPHPAVAVVRIALVWGALIAILVGLARYVRTDRERRALYVICILLVGYGGWVVARQLEDPGARDGDWWYEETLLQSTNATCVAAATCTYLHTLGVDLAETDAVRRGLISTNGGNEIMAWRIMKLSLPAERYRVRIGGLSREELQRSGKWYMTCVIYSAFTGHAVVIRVEPDGKHVTVRDPLNGQYTMPWETFAQRWLGNVVWAEEVGRPARAEQGELYAAYH